MGAEVTGKTGGRNVIPRMGHCQEAVRRWSVHPVIKAVTI